MTSSRTTWLWIVLLALVVGSGIPDSAFPQTYVRAGVMLDWPKDIRFQDENCSSLGSLYGCGDGNDSTQPGTLGDFGTVSGLEIGLGYAILPALRLEAAVQYRPNFSFEGHANFIQLDDVAAKQDVSAELSTVSGMLAAYLDIPISGFALLRHAPVNPFIGVGGGLSLIKISETRMNFPETSTIVPGDNEMSFSWMLSAGLAVSLRRWTVDVAWRYTDHGTVETGKGGQVVGHDGSREPLSLVEGGTRGDLRSHGLTASLRYEF